MPAPRQIEPVVWLVTTAHCRIAVNDGIEVNVGPFRLKVSEHARATHLVEQQAEVTHDPSVLTHNGSGSRRGVGRGDWRTTDIDRTPARFVLPCLAIPFIIDTRCSERSVGVWQVPNVAVQPQIRSVDGL